MLVSVNPYNQELIAEYPEDSEVQIGEKIEFAEKAFQLWRKTPLKERVKLIVNVGNSLQERKESLGKTIALEMGKPISEAVLEIEKCAKLCFYYGEHIEEFLKPEKIKDWEISAKVQYNPLGVILGIMPWNFPYWQVMRFVIPTVLTGNTVLLKHASNVTGCAQEIENLLHLAGFPQGVYQGIYLSGSKAENLISHSTIKGVSLTGSTAVGSKIGSLAGKYIKPSVLELGGSNAFIVCENADINKAVDDVVKGRFRNAGQSCIAAKRILVDETIYHQFYTQLREKVANLIVGDPLLSETKIGPMAKVSLAEELESQMDRTLDIAGELAFDHYRASARFRPNILSNIELNTPAFTEELFGPLAVIHPFNSWEDAVNISNDTDFGLGVSVYHQDPQFVLDNAADFNEGAVFVNGIAASHPALPFGGVKQSGYGRELAKWGAMEFVNVQTVSGIL